MRRRLLPIAVKCSPTARCGASAEKLSDTPYAYLKIAEGCDRKCSYCVIPQIRGQFRSVHPVRILEEAKALIQAGKKELILVAQDITEYGSDLKDYNLSRLIREIVSLEGGFLGQASVPLSDLDHGRAYQNDRG